jgi:hypothetical protein
MDLDHAGRHFAGSDQGDEAGGAHRGASIPARFDSGRPAQSPVARRQGLL